MGYAVLRTADEVRHRHWQTHQVRWMVLRLAVMLVSGLAEVEVLAVNMPGLQPVELARRWLFLGTIDS